MDSILNHTKKMIGIVPECTDFDTDIITGINTALANLTQIGVGPEEGFSIEDDEATWEDFVDKDPRLEPIKTFVHLKTKLLFDPPASSSAMEATKSLLAETEWRLNVTVDP